MGYNYTANSVMAYMNNYIHKKLGVQLIINGLISINLCKEKSANQFEANYVMKWT